MIEMKEKLKEINNNMQFCEKCELGILPVNQYTDGKDGYGKLPITGENFEYVFIGQNPSINRYEFSAFCGRTSGDTFKELCEKAGIKFEDIAIMNLVKCSTANNAPPDQEVILACTKEWLTKEIQLMKPKLVIAMGKTVCDFFGVKIGGFGRWNRIRVFGIYHPAMLKYDPSKEPVMLEMLKIVKKEMYDNVKITDWLEKDTEADNE
jgi:uracil-DNA glycosylase family 4